MPFRSSRSEYFVAFIDPSAEDGMIRAQIAIDRLFIEHEYQIMNVYI